MFFDWILKNIFFFSLVIVGLAVSIIIFTLSQVTNHCLPCILLPLSKISQFSYFSQTLPMYMLYTDNSIIIRIIIFYVFLRRCRCTRTMLPKCASSSPSSAATSSPSSPLTRAHSHIRLTRSPLRSLNVSLITSTRTHLSPYLAFWPLPDSSSSIFAPSLSSSLRRWSVLYHLSNCHHLGFPDYNAQAGGHRPPSSPRVHCLPSEHWVPINILIIDHHQHPPPPHHHQVLNQKVFVSRLLHSSDPPSFSTNSSPTAWKVIIIPIWSSSSSSQYYH